jgi:hypothetical protein
LLCFGANLKLGRTVGYVRTMKSFRSYYVPSRTGRGACAPVISFLVYVQHVDWLMDMKWNQNIRNAHFSSELWIFFYICSYRVSSTCPHGWPYKKPTRAFSSGTVQVLPPRKLRRCARKIPVTWWPFAKSKSKVEASPPCCVCLPRYPVITPNSLANRFGCQSHLLRSDRHQRLSQASNEEKVGKQSSYDEEADND